ncbi:hypothetical protein BG003_009136 [Podila horticola]|nr:hypothetical protein BG003_009136 [Podila horticola]
MQQQDLTDYLDDVEGLEGVELRQLGSFLKTSEEENLLGNLYRMTTSDGHVKWVCHDHYRVSYQEMHTQKLRDVVKLAKGEFDEQLGRVTITLTSSFAAAEFYNAVSKAKGILELIMDLSWECTRSDLEVLEDALKNSRLKGGLIRGKGFGWLAEALKSNLILTTLDLRYNSTGDSGAQALSEALKTNSTLIALDLPNNSIGGIGALALSEALKTNSTLTTLALENNSIGENGALALSEALKTNSTLTTLDMESNSIGDSIGDDGVEALKINSTLATLNLRANSIGNVGAQALSEALKTNSTLAILR